MVEKDTNGKERRQSTHFVMLHALYVDGMSWTANSMPNWQLVDTMTCGV